MPDGIVFRGIQPFDPTTAFAAHYRHLFQVLAEVKCFVLAQVHARTSERGGKAEFGSNIPNSLQPVRSKTVDGSKEHFRGPLQTCRIRPFDLSGRTQTANYTVGIALFRKGKDRFIKLSACSGDAARSFRLRTGSALLAQAVVRMLQVCHQTGLFIPADSDPIERDSEVGQAVPHLEAIALEFRYPTLHAQRCDGLCKVDPVPCGTSMHQCPSFAENGTDLFRSGEVVPQRNPYLATRIGFVGHRCACVSRPHLPYTERIDQCPSGGALHPFRGRSGEQQGTFDHQDEVPRVHQWRSEESAACVGTACDARSELANGGFDAYALHRIRIKSALQPTGRIRCWLTCVGTDHVQDPLHEVVGEVQAAVIAPRAQQRWILGALLREGYRSIHPCKCLINPYGSARLQDVPLVIASFVPHTEVLQHLFRRSNGFRVRCEPYGCTLSDGGNGRLIILWEESASSIPWCQHRRRPVILQEEPLQFLAGQRRAQLEVLAAPSAASVRILLFGHEAQDAKRLEVVGQGHGRASGEQVYVHGHEA